VVTRPTEIREVRSQRAGSRRKSPGTGIAVLPAKDAVGVKVLTTIIAVLLLISPSAAADRGIANIRVTPATSLEPANVSVQVAVERHADNRRLTIVVDSGSYYWSSERQLDGQNGPYLSVFNCRELPAGEYAVQASIVGQDGRVRATARNRIIVMSRTPDPVY
jgi:methionine-rich copper-binding protein CopC